MKATTFYIGGVPQSVELLAILSYHDWHIVQKSREFRRFQNLLDTLEKQHNRSHNQ